MTPNVNVITTTNNYLAPFWVDNILRDNRFFTRILRDTKKFDGAQYNMPMKYQKGVASVAFNGYDLLPITQQPTTVNMTFYPTFVATNVSLAGTDLSANAVPMQTLKLLAVQMESRSQDAADDIGNFLQGDGTGFGGKAPNGLANTIDDGTVASTYGGLSRTTYFGLNATVTPTTTLSLSSVRTLWNSISDGSVVPDFIITDYTTWGYFEQLQTPFQRNTYTDFAPNKSNNTSVSGYRDLIWDGMVVSRDKKITTGYFYMLNLEDTLDWYALKWWEGERVTPKSKKVINNVYQDSEYAPGDAFTWTGMVKSYNQAAINGFMIFGGQLMCKSPFRNGVLQGITGI